MELRGGNVRHSVPASPAIDSAAERDASKSEATRLASSFSSASSSSSAGFRGNLSYSSFSFVTNGAAGSSSGRDFEETDPRDTINIDISAPPETTKRMAQMPLLRFFPTGCSYAKAGCPWKGKVSELSNHIQNECSCAPVQCPFANLGCKSLVHYTSTTTGKSRYRSLTRREIEDHLREASLDHLLIVNSRLEEHTQKLTSNSCKLIDIRDKATSIESEQRKSTSILRESIDIALTAVEEAVAEAVLEQDNEKNRISLGRLRTSSSSSSSSKSEEIEEETDPDCRSTSSTFSDSLFYAETLRQLELWKLRLTAASFASDPLSYSGPSYKPTTADSDVELVTPPVDWRKAAGGANTMQTWQWRIPHFSQKRRKEIQSDVFTAYVPPPITSSSSPSPSLGNQCESIINSSGDREVARLASVYTPSSLTSASPRSSVAREDSSPIVYREPVGSATLQRNGSSAARGSLLFPSTGENDNGKGPLAAAILASKKSRQVSQDFYLRCSCLNVDDMMALYLRIPHTVVSYPRNWRMVVHLQLGIINQLKPKKSFFRTATHTFSTNSVSWGFPDFFPFKKMEEKKGFIGEDGSILIEVSLRLCPVPPSDGLQVPRVPNSSGAMFSSPRGSGAGPSR